MKFNLPLFIFLSFGLYGIGQNPGDFSNFERVTMDSRENDTCVTIQPGYRLGKDALLHGLASEVDINYGSNGQFSANAWTFAGVPGVVRSVIQFDLADLPIGTEIISAKLTLYGWDSPSGFGQHSTMSGSNVSWLQRVTTEWVEEEVTWNTQPTSTTFNRIALPESTSPGENYVDIDVAVLVQDMVDMPSESFGFMFLLQDESYYRLLNFMSSDHPNEDFHPKIEICYSLPADASVGEEEMGEARLAFSLYPNPTSNQVTIAIKNGGTDSVTIGVYDLQGNQVKHVITSSSNFLLNVDSLASGTYIVRLTDGKYSVNQKLIIS